MGDTAGSGHLPPYRVTMNGRFAGHKDEGLGGRGLRAARARGR